MTHIKCIRGGRSLDYTRNGRKPSLCPEVAAINQLRAQYKANAKLREVCWLLSMDEFKTLIKSNCYYCGSSPISPRPIVRNVEFLRNGIDRLDSSGDYVEWNVVSCCWKCNQAKMDLNPDEFIQWILQAADYLRLRQTGNLH